MQKDVIHKSVEHSIQISCGKNKKWTNNVNFATDRPTDHTQKTYAKRRSAHWSTLFPRTRRQKRPKTTNKQIKTLIEGTMETKDDRDCTTD